MSVSFMYIYGDYGNLTFLLKFQLGLLKRKKTKQFYFVEVLSTFNRAA